MMQLVIDSPQLATPSANASHIRPSSLQRDVGGDQKGSWGWRNARGDPGSGRPKQCVAKTGNDICRCPFLLPSPATDACYTQAATTTTSLASKREPEKIPMDFD